MALLCYAGEVDEGERAIAPFRALATPLADADQAYRQMCEPAEPGPDEEVARSLFVDSFDSRVAQTIVEHLRASPAPLAVAQIRVLGGAMTRVSAHATAFHIASAGSWSPSAQLGAPRRRLIRSGSVGSLRHCARVTAVYTSASSATGRTRIH